MHKQDRRRGKGWKNLSIETLEPRRLLVAADPDLTFNQDGHLTFDGGTGSAFTDVKVQGDGKILAVGQARLVQQGQFLLPVFGVFRYTVDGQLDESFGGGDGIADLPHHWDPESRGYSLSLLDDGRIVAGGEVYWGGVAGAARFDADGIADPTLGGGAGYIQAGLNISPYPPIMRARVIADPGDGKIYIVGGDASLNSDSAPGIDVFRFNADGSRDFTFGDAGGLHVPTWGGTVPEDIATLDSGKLLIAGKQYNPSAGALEDYYLRLTTGGFPDTTFGGDGLVEDSFTGRAARGIVPLPDDSFFVAGGAPGPSSGDGEWSLLARFTPSGTLDPSFGDFFSGVKYGLHPYPFQDMVMQGDGKLLAIFNTGSEIGLTRLTDTGDADPSYGSGGTTLTTITGNELALRLAVDPYDRAVVAGSIDNEMFALIARFTGDTEPGGTVTAQVARDLAGEGFRGDNDPPLAGRTVFIDQNFNWQLDDGEISGISNAGGQVTLSNVPPGQHYLLQIVPAGWKASSPLNGYALVDVLPGQTVSAGDFLTVPIVPSPHLDTTFGSGGATLLDAGDQWSDQLFGLTRLPDGKLLAAGYFGGSFAFFRFNSNGTIDNTFGTDGRIAPSLPAGVFPGSNMLVQPDGKLLVSGSNSSPSASAVLRFTAAGDLDSTFGTGGMALLSGWGGQFVRDMALDGDGRVIVVGRNNSSDTAVARLTAAGQYDNSFDGDGKGVYDAHGSDDVGGVAVEADNQIVFVGDGFFDASTFAAWIVRLGETGAKDQTFGTGGVAKLMLAPSNGVQPPGYRPLDWRDVKLMADGRIVVAGWTSGAIIAARFTPAGALDSTFAAGQGYAFASFTRPGGAPASYASANFIELLSDGSFYAAGEADTTASSQNDLAVARFRSDGALEAGFGAGGVATAAFASGSERLSATAVDPSNGRLILAGSTGAGAALLAKFAAPAPDPQNPFLGNAFSVGGTPVTIQFEDFDNGGEGIAYHDVEASNLGGQYRSGGVDISATSDTGGGHYVGFVKTGEWLEYTIDVAQAGTYTLDVRLAAASSNGKFHVEIAGIDKTGLPTVPNTGGFQNWTPLSKSGVNLSAGQHVLRVFMDAAGSNGSVGNFNWLKLTREADPMPAWMQASPDAQYSLTSTALTVSAGTISLLDDVATTHPDLAVSVLAGAELSIAATQHLASLDLADGARALLASGGAENVLVVKSLALADNATLDLKGSPLIVNYSGTSPLGHWAGSAYEGLIGWIASSRNGGPAGAGLWSGFGIGSSDAAASAGLNTLGIAEASQVLGLSGAQTATWHGQSVDATSALVMYTYAGDANLDGKINIDDYGRIDGNVATSGSAFGYFNGDFNYDGKINIDDYGIIDGNINRQGGAFASVGVAASGFDKLSPGAAMPAETIVRSLAAIREPHRVVAQQLVVRRAAVGGLQFRQTEDELLPVGDADHVRRDILAGEHHPS